MRHDVILVLLDGLNHSVARDCMGHLQALCGAGRGQSYRLECELPSLSRPLYECILTGVPPIDSGILHNDVVRLEPGTEPVPLRPRGRPEHTAAAAYHWVSELYNRAPFDPARDRHTDDSALPIQRGHFYWSDHYPDSHLFADAESLAPPARTELHAGPLDEHRRRRAQARPRQPRLPQRRGGAPTHCCRNTCTSGWRPATRWRSPPITE